MSNTYAKMAGDKNVVCPIAIGIDVSKDSLSACLAYHGQASKLLEFGNNETDINAFIKDELSGLSFSGKIVMESTGRFHFLPSMLLAKSGLDVRVINPLIAKKYSQSRIRKVKSDKADSQILAEIALKEEDLPQSFKADKKAMEINKKISLVSALEKQIQQFSTVIKDYQANKENLGMALSAAEKQIINTVKKLKKQKDNLEKEIEKSVKSEGDTFGSQIDQLASVPGVSDYMATLATHFFSQKECSSPKQWIAFTGMDISVRQSGHWHGKCRMTKRGNAYLRKRLFCCAWGAIMSNKNFRAYYDQLKQKGRKHVEALMIIARKLLRIMFGILKNGTTYDATISVINN